MPKVQSDYNKDIPEISFWKNKELQIKGFQFFNLEDFVNRDLKASIDHNPYTSHRLNFYAILAISGGEIEHSVDFKKYTLQKGDVLVISRGQIHAFQNKADYQGFLVVFSEAFMQKYMAQSTISQINHLYNYFLKQDKINNPVYNQILSKNLVEELKNNSTSSPNIIASLLSIYLLKLNDKKNSHLHITSDNKHMEYFNQFREMVQNNYSQTRDAKVFASKLAISYKHLNDICKNVVKTTAKSFIDNYVTLEAKRMLVSTSLSIKEIAFNLGFDEPTNFQKYFKKHSNLTPLEFRKNLI